MRGISGPRAGGLAALASMLMAPLTAIAGSGPVHILSPPEAAGEPSS
jgi:hypothetical protein